jgi:alanyl-tRNA synthetase
MGETGPCGPCTEIHFDHIGGRNAASLVNKGDATVIEIWNLVFMAFNRESSGNLVNLPAKHVDTGMGFERLLSILQGKTSNYDTDVFAPLFKSIQEITGADPYSGQFAKCATSNVMESKDMAYRVIADHIRALTFAISDGAIPGPVGRGYVIRRILRRAVRYGKEFLNAKVGFFSQLVPVVASIFENTFVIKDPASIQSILLGEEQKFAKAFDKGLVAFRRLVKRLNPGDIVSGKDVFLLYSTFGFPDDLTRIMAEDRGFTIDSAAFQLELAKARQESCQAAKKKAPNSLDIAL